MIFADRDSSPNNDNLSWIKTGWTNKLYADGFTNQFALIGSPYMQPSYATRLVAVTNVSLNSFEWQFNHPTIPRHFHQNQQHDHDHHERSNSLKFTFIPPSGQFKGTFWHPQAGQLTNFFGVVLQLQKFGGGVFLGTNQSGTVRLQGY